MRFPATCRSLTSNNITFELTIIDVLIDTNCLKTLILDFLIIFVASYTSVFLF